MLLRTCSHYQQVTQTPSEPSLAKYQGEQVLVRHAENIFLNILMPSGLKKNSELKRGKKKKVSNTIVNFPGN